MIEMKLMIMDALRSGSSWAGQAVCTTKQSFLFDISVAISRSIFVKFEGEKICGHIILIGILEWVCFSYDLIHCLDLLK